MSYEPISDPAIKIRPSNKLIEFIDTEVKISKELPENILFLKKSVSENKNNCLLAISDIKYIKELVSEVSTAEKKIYLHKILEGVDIILPTPKVIPRNPELEARVKKLKILQDARTYRAMTKGVDSSRKHLPEDTIAYQMRAINRQLIAVVQFIFSVLAGFAFGFIGLELLIGELDFGFRLLLGIMCALIIALAEIYFLAKKLNEDDNDMPIRASSKEKLHKE